MRSRPYRESDKEILKSISDQSGYPYPDLSDPLIEAVEIIEDNDGRIVAAAAARRLVELYLYLDPVRSTTVKMSAISMLHKSMAAALRGCGYSSAEAFLPPQIMERFGRRLLRTFGWSKNWPSFHKRL